MDPGRFSNRYKAYQKLIDKNPNREWMSDYQQQSMLRSMDNAYRLLNAKEKQAFVTIQWPQANIGIIVGCHVRKPLMF